MGEISQNFVAFSEYMNFIPHSFASRRSWIDSDANEEIDIADSAGSSLKMSSSFTMQRATDALLDYWIIDCYRKITV